MRGRISLALLTANGTYFPMFNQTLRVLVLDIDHDKQDQIKLDEEAVSYLRPNTSLISSKMYVPSYV